MIEGETVELSQASLVVSFEKGSGMIALEPMSDEVTDVELIDSDDDGQETAPPCRKGGGGGEDSGSRVWGLGGVTHRLR